MRASKLSATVALASLAATSLHAEGTTKSSFFTNDFLGDGEDRWRSGSYTVYLNREGGGQGILHGRGGAYSHNFRFRSEIISPWGSSDQPDDEDRPYVGLLAFGSYINERIGDTQLHFGAELVMLGEQTGIARFQQGFHEAMGYDGYMPLDAPHEHVADSVGGNASLEAARTMRVGSGAMIRPFAEGQYGYETYGRIGVDWALGAYVAADRVVRDPVSGFIEPAANKHAAMRGLNLIGGIDYTHMASSHFIPEGGDVELEAGRWRARLGAQVGIGPVSMFYGLTHLTKEFSSQVEGQTVGTVSIGLVF